MAVKKGKKAARRERRDPLAYYRDLLSPDQQLALEMELLKPLSSAIRINPLKTNPDQEIERLCDRYGWQASPVPFCPTGWQVENARPSQTVEYRLGYYYIQDSASMLPVELFDFDTLPAPLVLDLAAAPGGKTTHLASRTGDQGLIIANDTSKARLTGLRASLQNWGMLHAAITNFAGERFGSWFPGTFDRILLDAPCSMENLRPTRSHPVRRVTERERRSLVQRQLNLLASAFLAVKPGGQIVYATCTLAPEEDEGVVDSLLQRYPGQVEVEDVSARFDAPLQGLSHHGERTYDPTAARAARLWPFTFGTSGFFCALLTKTGETSGTAQQAPQRSPEKMRYSRLQASEIKDTASILEDDYGFDLLSFIQQQALSLWQKNWFIFAFPEIFFSRFEGLPFFSLGLPVGQLNRGSFTPAHEFTARYGLEFQQGIYVLADEQQPDWLDRKSIPVQTRPDHIPDSRVFIVMNNRGRNLGRGRLSGDQLRYL